MSAKFERKRGKDSPAISTASLPDIIFILLFFFMVATVMRDSDALVTTHVPKATELTKIEKKSMVSTINIGPPVNMHRAKYGTAPRVQLNDKFAAPTDVIEFVENERLKKDERLRPYMTFALKVDKKTKMGIVTDVKQELRKAKALKIQYNAAVRTETLN
ncbi:MAG: biopolymer transporter ExbD [Bacteroidota bacterium]|nr:biopolymer transporter ExbD [Bacteroidota bacterium]